MKHPLITIIIPTIGRPNYMPMTIWTATKQTYQNIEILISDNHVSFPTAELMLNHNISDDRIRVIERPERMSFSCHMNACIDDSSGEYLMILSDDDWLAPDYIEEMVTAISKNNSISVCLGQQATIGADDLIYPYSDCLKETSSPLLYEGSQFIKQNLTGKGLPNIKTFVCMFVSKKSIESLGGFALYPNGAHSDNILMLRLATLGDVYIGRSIYYYRVYDTSSGLSMPFKSLVCASKLYVSDLSACLAESMLYNPLISFYLLLNSLYLITRMLHSRYINLYSNCKNPISKFTYVQLLIMFLFATVSRVFKNLLIMLFIYHNFSAH